MIKRWWPTILTLAVVLYATLWPDPAGSDVGGLFEGADKLIHAIMMGGLLSAILFDRRRAGRILTRRYVLIAVAAMFVFAVFDEVAQGAMQLGRSFEAFDLLADWGGIVIAALTAPPVIKRIFRKKT